MTAAPRLADDLRVQSWRRVWVANAHGPLTCSDGHRIHDPLVWESGCLRCRHRPSRRAPECGKLVYLIGGGLTNVKGQPIVLLAEVTAAEMREMMEARMDANQALTYLGIQFPG